jgi:uncharacterized protein involved in type VI secretion and phage assembly
MDRAPSFERPAGWLFGGQLAQVVSLADPDNLNRVQIRLIAFDGMEGQDMPLWARVVAPFAGDERGAFFMPDVGDEVLVVFVQGDPRHPLVVGGLWSGGNAAPASIGAGGNIVKRIRSKNGLQITLEDRQGQENIRLETPGGQSLTLRDGPGAILFEDSNGNSVRLESGGFSFQSSINVKIEAPKVDVTAGMVTVDAAMAKFSGVVKCETLIATTVVSSVYTPGAGNIW